MRIPKKSLSYLSLTTLKLVTIGTITTTLLMVTYQQTNKTINEQEQKATLNKLYSVLPPNCFDNELINDYVEVKEEALGHYANHKLYRARLNNQPVAVIIPTTARNGYNGNIELLVGIFADGTIAGVRVIKHKETPGLGDAIEIKKSNWMAQFNKKSLANTIAWKVKKDDGVFDQLTSATITSRAVTKAIKQALIYYELNQEKIFNGTNYH